MNGFSMKTKLYKSLSPILHCIRFLGEKSQVEAIEIHRILSEKHKTRASGTR